MNPAHGTELTDWVSVNGRTGCGHHFNGLKVHSSGARGRNRTGTVFLPRDFKSLASTNFATRAQCGLSLHYSKREGRLS